MVPLTGDFCQNIAEEDSLKEHMEKYKDIFCLIITRVKSNVKDIEKVNITYQFSTNYKKVLHSGL